MRIFILFLMLIALLVPATVITAQETEPSTGCQAMNNVSGPADDTYTFGPDDFLAGETITVTVTGSGNSFTLEENCTEVAGPAAVGDTLTYEITADGNYT